MALKYELRGVPDDIPYGDYAVRVSEESHWEGRDLIVIADYVGPIDKDNPTLITFTKKDDGHSLTAANGEEN